MPDPSRIPSPTEAVTLAESVAAFWRTLVLSEHMTPDAAASATSAYVAALLMRERGVPIPPWEEGGER